MTELSSRTATVELLDAARGGDRSAVDRLFSLAYDELRHLAHLIRRPDTPSTLNTTALVHEAYLKLLPGRELALEDRAHFTHIVARAMRQVIVDAVRTKSAEKRGGGTSDMTLEESLLPGVLPTERLLDLDAALTELEQLDPRRARVVECRFFGGLSVEETAAAMGISTATVKRDWRLARAWLAQALSE
jgi:RNA polymerase sigma factor (TIGR02999 family)